MFISGFVAVVGRPNVGKSTLINALMGQKVLIVSDKPQTTRNRIQAVLTAEHFQVVFIDTPGIHRPRHRLGDYMLQSALGTLKEVDLVLLVVEATSPPGNGDRFIAQRLKSVGTPVLLVINKIDVAPEAFAASWLQAYVSLLPVQGYLQVSARTGQNTQLLLKEILRYLPEGPLYYPEGMITDRPLPFQVSEIIREKIFMQTREEIPHSIAVEVTKIAPRENKDLVDIDAVIFVEKASQKKIMIGKGGTRLKAIGQEARVELEELLGSAVYLDLWVKVKADWRRKNNILRQLGYE